MVFSQSLGHLRAWILVMRRRASGRGKFLRGTQLDPFDLLRERRTERRVRDDYLV
jgi:hypothetical protein